MNAITNITGSFATIPADRAQLVPELDSDVFRRLDRRSKARQWLRLVIKEDEDVEADHPVWNEYYASMKALGNCEPQTLKDAAAVLRVAGQEFREACGPGRAQDEEMINGIIENVADLLERHSA